MPTFTISRSQNRFLKKAKSTPTMTATIAIAKRANYSSVHFSALWRRHSLPACRTAVTAASERRVGTAWVYGVLTTLPNSVVEPADAFAFENSCTVRPRGADGTTSLIL
jgi:hypothetical protein